MKITKKLLMNENYGDFNDQDQKEKFNHFCASLEDTSIKNERMMEIFNNIPQNEKKQYFVSRALNSAFVGGRTDIIKELFNNNVKTDQYTMDSAIVSGFTELMNSAWSNGARPSRSSAEYAYNTSKKTGKDENDKSGRNVYDLLKQWAQRGFIEDNSVNDSLTSFFKYHQ